MQNEIRSFLESPAFQKFSNIVRILLLIALIVLIFIMVKEINTVKLLGSDVCKICMEKTGAMCFLQEPQCPTCKSFEFNLSEIEENIKS